MKKLSLCIITCLSIFVLYANISNLNVAPNDISNYFHVIITSNVIPDAGY